MMAFQFSRRRVAQKFEGARTFWRREGANDRAMGLGCERIGKSGMAVAEAGDADAGEKIDVTITVGIGKRGAFAVVESDAGELRDTLAAGRDIAILAIENLARFGSGYSRLHFGHQIGGALAR